MLVLPCHANLFVEDSAIAQFLLNCQRSCRNRDCTQIVSLSLEIESTDPLILLQLTKPDELSFYFENRGKGEAIAAIGAVAKFQLSNSIDRFNQAQQFINSCLANTTALNIVDGLFTGPHFFCSFSFFGEHSQVNYPFPGTTIFLPQWQIATRQDRCIFVANLVIDSQSNVETSLQKLREKINEVTSFYKGRFQENIVLKCATNYNLNQVDSYQRGFVDQSGMELGDFKRAVLSSLKLINSKKLNKIVIAQAIDVESIMPFRLLQSLNNLRILHSNCHIFSISNGKGQNFIGASPERLISIHKQELMVDALAGSASRGKTAVEDANLANYLLNSAKERREHQVVIDFITQHLEKLSLVPHLSPPQLRQLSNIQHLWTPIRAKVPINVQPLEIVAELHPTPAVAGDSREIACAEIRRYESFERGLYAAPLGWIDYRNNSEFIVGIRSALIDGDRARLYAGAGIVAGSDPDKELTEIQLKFQAILKALV
ncbi:MAG: isochorismate synthase [Chroococcidiopsidaceae cyanobacterium CP_BM_ER_R8_30]|nr:isochorismate synthase [Chroococcidiopsidaceae cyanobacterium CP_BM_ER_R8_30]